MYVEGSSNMFDPRDPMERFYWHYDSRRQLSMAQIIAMDSVDVETVALIWLLLEHGVSLTVAGPTDPQPGIGKTTTLNALLQFLPEGTALAYMSGMYENFAFTRIPSIDPVTTYALCNEVSDHLPIYMWGRIARRYLTLPAQGYHSATSIHADTIADVISMYHHDLHLRAEDVRRLGLVVNIGLVGRVYPLRRRWFTTHFFQPDADPQHPDDIVPIPLSLWNEFDDTFEHADQAILDDLAQWTGIPPAEFASKLRRRIEALRKASKGYGVDNGQMYDAIDEVRQCEKKSLP
jgi:hypothetical protein